MATFGKALGNGYAINAIIGSDSVMNYAKSTFISSTFWTERIGSAAAIKTLEIMEKTKSWNVVKNIGKGIKEEWLKFSKNYNIKLKITGLDSLPRFDFLYDNNLYYKTFISQEFLKKGFLASNSIYLSISHNDKIIESYLDILESIFRKIKISLDKKIDPKNLLNGPVCINGIRSKL